MNSNNDVESSKDILEKQKKESSGAETNKELEKENSEDVKKSDYLSFRVDEDKTGENNPLNQMEKGTDTRNPIIKFLEHFGELFVLNLIFILACIPIITIGASVTALLTMTNKMVRAEDGNIWEGFWKAFRANFKPATILWVISLIYMYVIYIVYMMMIRQGETASNVLTVILGLLLVVFTFIFPLLYPIVARYENTTMNYIKNSLIISVANLKAWFVITVIWFIPIFVFMASPIVFAYIWYLWVLIMCSACAYSTSLIMMPIYEKLENKDTVDENSSQSETAEK